MSRLIITYFFCVMALSSCGTPPQRIESDRQRHVVLLPGIVGRKLDIPGIDALSSQIERELPDVSAQVWDWTALESEIHLTALYNLTDYERNRRRASTLAREIETWTREHPGSPLYLIAHSGGAGIALFACDELSPDTMLEGIILVSGGVSPQYDLTTALAHTRLGVFNYSSEKDARVLRDGTTRHGTMDRRYGPSVGYAGFETVHPKLFQLKWDPGMRRLWNYGGHSTGLRPAFARQYYFPVFEGNVTEIAQQWPSAQESK